MMALPSIQQAAQALGGDVYRGQEILCPGPGHSRADRSMQIRFDPGAPDGFVCRSYANDDFRACRDYIKGRLGLPSRGGAFRFNLERNLVSEPDEKLERRKRWA